MSDGEKKLSKKALKKLEAKKKKAAAKEARRKELEAEQSKLEAEKAKELEKYSDICGDLPLIRSKTREGKVFSDIKNFGKDAAGQTVYVRGRAHNVRGKGGICFIIVRQRQHTIQATLSAEGLPKLVVNFAQKITTESIIDVEGKLVVPEDSVESCSVKTLEIAVTKIFVVSRAEPLPIQVTDCSIPLPLLRKQAAEIAAIDAEIAAINAKKEKTEEDKKKLTDLAAKKAEAATLPHVGQKVRLDNRVIDLRTRANQAIFKVQSMVGALFREHLLKKGFTEIHSPKIISAASEGGAEVFKLGYFESDAFLAQSPQLYKQMAICADMEKVFEIGPVFRAENSHTHRHLCEFMGLDIEMAIKEHYHEALDVLDTMFVAIFDGLAVRCATELATINEQFPFEPLKYRKKTLRLDWKEAIALLRADGVKIGDLEDVNTEQEKRLGKLVKAKYDTDFFFLDKFPTAARPFYTMLDVDDPDYTNSYDFFVRGEEITSGAQRIHDPKMLAERATVHKIELKTIQQYIDAFKYGAPPHAGCGIGLERLVMLYLGLPNIRRSSLFPRDPNRLTP